MSASLVSVNCAEAVPETFGLNLTFIGTFCPTATVRGSARPGSVNSELFDWAAEIVTGAPVAESVIVSAVLEPTVTLPKSRLAGLITKCGGRVATPTPYTWTTNLGY